MGEEREKPDAAEEATTFFNRGRRYSAEIAWDNEHLRSKIRRLEQALRERRLPSEAAERMEGTSVNVEPLLKVQQREDEGMKTTDEIPPAIVESFRAEARELLGEMEGTLMELESRPEDGELVGRAFRGLHTIKGNAAMLGFEALEHAAHDLEHLFDLVRKGERRVSRAIVDAALSAKDRLLALLEPGGDTPEESRRREALRRRIQGLIAGTPPVAGTCGGAAGAGRSGIQLSLDDSPEQRDAATQEAAETCLSGVRREATGAPKARESEARARGGGDGGDSLRVDTSKLDLVMNLVGELVTAEARLARLVALHAAPELQLVAEEVGRLAGELRDASLDVRMVPIGPSFGRFRRLVRDLTNQLGRDAELQTGGGETELDKKVIDRLADPLVHLLRNCVDHGIESPEERLQRGKPRRGVVRLEAGYDGSQVVIVVADDGRGIDHEAVRRQAIERGLLGKHETRPERELFSLMFLPGFTTSPAVTSVSGRGVGLDVVKRAVEGLRGTVEVESRAGEGTRFEIRLPLTLAIIEGLEVAVGSERYIVPLSAVQECVEVPAGSRGAGALGLAAVRGELVPAVRLRQWFGGEGDAPPHEHLVVSAAGGYRAGLVVDQVVGGCQAVIKPLGALFAGVPGLAGSTIRGDGSVVLILDVLQLLRAVERAGGARVAAA
jgi:chemotaxis protein histidine kinase CheA